jgi:hypothetical protein
MTQSPEQELEPWRKREREREKDMERQIAEQGYITPPSFLEMVKSFKTTALKFINQGAPIVEPAVYTDRLGECNTCEFLRRKNMRCGACGCLLEAKAQMKTAYCPKGKWENGMAPGRDDEK